MRRRQLLLTRNMHFNPRTPCGVRHVALNVTALDATFQSTHPMRGATRMDGSRFSRCEDFNPRTPCGVRRQNGRTKPAKGLFQSTHPMRGATRVIRRGDALILISIHAPHAGCDCAPAAPLMPVKAFQSTHPMRGATAQSMAWHSTARHFNPRTPCGVRLLLQ